MFSMKKAYISLLITTLLLTGCANKGTHTMYKNGDVVFKNSNNYLINVEDEIIVNRLISSGDSVAIYYGLDGCSSCEEVKSNLMSYVKDVGQLIYYVSSNSIDMNRLNFEYKEFQISNLYLFDNKELIKVFNKDALNNPKMVKNNLASSYRKSNTYLFNDVINFVNYMSSETGDAYVVANWSKVAMEYYNKNVKDKFGRRTSIVYYYDGIRDEALHPYGIGGNYLFTHLTFKNGNIKVITSETIENLIY